MSAGHSRSSDSSDRWCSAGSAGNAARQKPTIWSALCGSGPSASSGAGLLALLAKPLDPALCSAKANPAVDLLAESGAAQSVDGIRAQDCHDVVNGQDVSLPLEALVPEPHHLSDGVVLVGQAADVRQHLVARVGQRLSHHGHAAGHLLAPATHATAEASQVARARARPCAPRLAPSHPMRSWAHGSAATERPARSESRAGACSDSRRDVIASSRRRARAARSRGPGRPAPSAGPRARGPSERRATGI